MSQIKLKGTERILITRTDRVGDLVLSTPVFEAIKKKYPKCFLSVMVFKETAGVLHGNPWIDEVIIYDKKGKYQSWLKSSFFGLSLRKRNFDVAIHLHPTNRVNLISWLAGIPIRIGYRVLLGGHGKNHFLLTHVIDERKWEEKKHEAEYNFDLLRFIDVKEPNELRFYYPLNPKDNLSLRDLMPFDQPYVVFHPSASCLSKRWPVERMAKIADSLAQQRNFRVIIIGDGDGVKQAHEMEQTMTQRAMNLAGKLNLEMLGWVLKSAQLLVSNDSGPVHIASAVQTPVVSIFGRNRMGLGPRRWRPLGRRSSFLQKEVGCVECLAHECQIDFKCLKELRTEEVMEEVQKYV